MKKKKWESRARGAFLGSMVGVMFVGPMLVGYNSETGTGAHMLVGMGTGLVLGAIVGACTGA